VDLLTQADALVINGGYSAVSEVFALRKPVFVVPVPGHAEQFVNANLVQELGLGFMATEQSVLEQLLNMHQENRWLGLKAMPDAFEIDGAREAASAILSFPESIRTAHPAKSSVPVLVPGEITRISHAGASREL
jgi:UDP:flavonoid glycosyltransferase YjiC (YdhE family)